MAATDKCILDAVAASWDEEFVTGVKNKNNCSGFVKSVLAKLGVPMAATLNADGIVNFVGGAWTKLDSGVEAASKAAAGTLVIAGLKGSGHTPSRTHGHVAIVVAGTLYNKKYPLVWGGSMGSAQSQGTKSTGEVWNRTDRDNVQYYAYSTAVCAGR